MPYPEEAIPFLIQASICYTKEKMYFLSDNVIDCIDTSALMSVIQSTLSKAEKLEDASISQYKKVMQGSSQMKDMNNLRERFDIKFKLYKRQQVISNQIMFSLYEVFCRLGKEIMNIGLQDKVAIEAYLSKVALVFENTVLHALQYPVWYRLINESIQKILDPIWGEVQSSLLNSNKISAEAIDKCSILDQLSVSVLQHAVLFQIIGNNIAPDQKFFSNYALNSLLEHVMRKADERNKSLESEQKGCKREQFSFDAPTKRFRQEYINRFIASLIQQLKQKTVPVHNAESSVYNAPRP